MEYYVSDFKVGENKYIEKIAKESRRICIIFGPPGAGKDTIKDILLKDKDKVGIIRTTSRRRERNEVQDLTYHYVCEDGNMDNFSEVRKSALLSYKFHGNYYWENACELYQILISNPSSYIFLSMGSSQGVLHIKKILKEALAFCIIPISDEFDEVEECIYRISSRKRETGKRLQERISIIKEEIKSVKLIADFIIQNPRGNLNYSVEKIKNILNNKEFM